MHRWGSLPWETHLPTPLGTCFISSLFLLCALKNRQTVNSLLPACSINWQKEVNEASTTYYFANLKSGNGMVHFFVIVGGKVASRLVRPTLEKAVQVRALVEDTVFSSWARHLTLTVPLSTQVYKWVPPNCWGNLTKLQGSDLWWNSIPSRRNRNTSSCFMLQKPG